MPKINADAALIESHVAKKIYEARCLAGLSRVSLADMVGVTHQQLHKYENGTNRISIGRLCLIANAVGRPLEYFLEEGSLGQIGRPSRHEKIMLSISKNLKHLNKDKYSYAIAQMIKIMAEDAE